MFDPRTMTCAIHDESDELRNVAEDSRRFASFAITRQRWIVNRRFVGDNLLHPIIDRNVVGRNVVVERRRRHGRAQIRDGFFGRIISVLGRTVRRNDT